MSYSFSLENIDEFYYYNKDKRNLIQLPNNLGYIETQKEIISEDIFLYKNDLHYLDEASMYAESSAQGLHINITLKGNLHYKNLLLKKDRDNLLNSISIDYINEEKRIFNITKNSHNKNIGIIIKNNFLEKNLFNHFKDKNMKIIQDNYQNNITSTLKSSLANTRILFLANEIYNSPFDGALNSIYLQSRVYEIIYNEFRSLLFDKKYISSNKIKFSQKDIESLHKAKEIIMESKKTFSIPNLARQVALNENKLKYGFKHLFNKTPGDIMLETRMYEAKKLLKNSELNVTEISKIVGYKYVQSFTVAFGKYFGQNPSDIMKTRKYYY